MLYEATIFASSSKVTDLINILIPMPKVLNFFNASATATLSPFTSIFSKSVFTFKNKASTFHLATMEDFAFTANSRSNLSPLITPSRATTLFVFEFSPAILAPSRVTVNNVSVSPGKACFTVKTAPSKIASLPGKLIPLTERVKLSPL